MPLSATEKSSISKLSFIEQLALIDTRHKQFDQKRNQYKLKYGSDPIEDAKAIGLIKP